MGYYINVRMIRKYKLTLLLMIAFSFFSYLKLAVFSNHKSTSTVFPRETSSNSDKEENHHKYPLTSRLKTINQFSTDSVTDVCFESFKRLAPEENQLENTHGRLPHLDLMAVKLVCSTLTKDSSVLEWGCGGSTAFFSSYVANWVCVEHDPHWGKIVQDQLSNQTFRNKVEVNIVPVNEEYIAIFEDDTFNDGTYEEFRDYVEFPASLNKQFDVIFDDGRARVPAALSVLRNKLIKKNGVLIIHDWERLDYRVVLKQGFVLVEVDTDSQRELAILKPTVKY